MSIKSRRYVIITRDELAYNHSELEYHNHDPLGTIFLKHIGSIVPYEEERSAKLYKFAVSASTWIKKDVVKSHRTFVFMAETEDEREEWITTIEFLKIVAVYRNFQKAFGMKLRSPFGHEETAIQLFDLKLNTITMNNTKTVSNAEYLTKRKPTGKNSFSSNQEDVSQATIRSERVLKEPIKAMFNYMFMHFVSRLMENSIKGEESDSLKVTPKIIQKNKVLEQIQSEWSNPSTNNPRNSLKRRQSSRLSVIEKIDSSIVRKREREGNLLDAMRMNAGVIDRSVVGFEEEANKLRVIKAQISKKRASLKQAISNQPKIKRPHRFSVVSEISKSFIGTENKVSELPSKINEVSEVIVESKPKSKYKEEEPTVIEELTLKSENNNIQTIKRNVKHVEMNAIQMQNKYQSNSLGLMEKVWNSVIKKSDIIKHNKLLASNNKVKREVHKEKKTHMYSATNDYKTKDLDKILEDTKVKYAIANRKIESMGGDIFVIEEGETVQIIKIDTEDNLATCSSRGLLGLFTLDALNIKQTDSNKSN